MSEQGFSLAGAMEAAGVLPGSESSVIAELARREAAGNKAGTVATLEAIKADYRHAQYFKPSPQATSGAGVGRQAEPPREPEPAPGSLEAIARQWEARNGGGFGLKAVGQTPTDISRRPTPPPASEAWRPPGDQQAIGGSLEAHLRGIVDRGATGFGLGPVK